MTEVRRIMVFLFALLLTTSLAYAELEKNMVKRQPLGKTPVDIAQSVSDGRLFVLLQGGDV